MINRKISLVSPHLFTTIFEELDTKKSDDIIVKPTLLSICAADLRYYTGERDEKVLNEKLPMALIHEGIGEVVFDPKDEYEVGDLLVLVPNTPSRKMDDLKENYDRQSKFRSSSQDGYMQDFVAMERDRVISVKGIDPEAAVMSELLSVVFNAIDDIPKIQDLNDKNIGVWGNGNLGYLAVLVLRYLYPESNISVFGRNTKTKINFFQADNIYNISEDLSDVVIDVAFECVGGNASEKAINQIIDIIQPQGHIALLGVSENAPKINTRMVLEKGLSLQGSSRSGREQFQNSVDFLRNGNNSQEAVKRLITEKFVVKSIEDANEAFNAAVSSKFKTIMKWEI